MAGIYVHIPFCSSFCIYCDFYSELSSRRMDDYAAALGREAFSRRDFFNDGVQPSTLYVGGGTPSLLSARQLEAIVGAVRGAYGVGDFEEFTLEANPDDVTADKLALWRSLGVNRLSMGVQSFDDAHLRWMRRRHDAAEAKRAFAMAREAGFDNISIDLIFGYASLERREWEDSIAQAVALHPEHISCYQMSIESGSALGALAASGKYVEPAQEVCAGQYSLLQQRLAEAGYRQYEISNFALPGRESRHNSAYWKREPYVGLGPAAHSFDGDRTRSWNVDSLEDYLAARAAEGAPDGSACGCERLSDVDAFNETLMLSLRRAEGFDLASVDPALLARIQPRIDGMLAEGLLAPVAGGRLRIPADRWFVSDDIIGRLFI
ncbi:MAG: radical SAM family heme chaperone HemW [Bacteroidales bacterium]|nr:radical SAM family heme chaperone HemW [Bacteroidales bacterium]